MGQSEQGGEVAARIGALEAELERTRERLAALEAEHAESWIERHVRPLTAGLRSPVSVVTGVADTIRNGKDFDLSLLPQVAQSLAASSRHLRASIEDLSDYVELCAGRLTLRPAPSDPRLIVQDLDERFRPWATDKGLRFEVLTEMVEANLALFDSERLRQLVGHLVSNAIKFSTRGVVQLKLRARADGPQTILRYEVSDEGPGIAASLQQRMFEAFERGGDEPGRRIAGLGIGLAIVVRLAAAMGARLGLRSQPGAGSTFWCDVPVRPIALEDALEALGHAFEGPAVGPLSLVDPSAAGRKLAAVLCERLAIDARIGPAFVGVGDPPSMLVVSLEQPLVAEAAARSWRAEPATRERPLIALWGLGDIVPAEFATCPRIDRPLSAAALRGLWDRLRSGAL